MTAQTDTNTEPKGSGTSFVRFLLISLALLALLLGGIWWAKARSQTVAQQSGNNVAQQGSDKKPTQPAPQPTQPSQPQPSGSNQGSNPTSPAPAPAPNPQSSSSPNLAPTGPGPVHSGSLPSTGPSVVDVLLSGFMMALAGYFGLRLLQIRQAMKPQL